MTTTGSTTAPPKMAAAMPKVPKTTDLQTTAFSPSVGLSNTMISTLRLGRRELVLYSGWRMNGPVAARPS